MFETPRILSYALPLGPLCHFHHFGGGGKGTLDPETQAIMDASFVALTVILLSSSFMCAVGGPLILLLTHKIRHLFWSIPLVNVFAYLVAAIARPYPGGVWARFQMPVIIHTAIELFVLVVLSLGAAILLATICVLYRLVKTLRRRVLDDRSDGPAATWN